MAIGKRGAVLGQIHTLFNVGTFHDLTDGQLLERFATGQSEAAEPAFAVLVERHGPMVLRVCYVVLGDAHDAHDAFQATFLVLVRKARGLWVRDSLGPWLHQVAHRTARCARASGARRRKLEARALPANIREAPDVELGQILHEEIERLPERYRAPLILCDLEGRTHEQAARHLGWPIGTVKSRQSRARERLRDRLTRRGHAPDSAMLLAALKNGAASPVPPALADATTTAAAHYLVARTIVRASVASLAQEVHRTMFITHGWKVASAVLALGVTVSGTALLSRGESPRAEATLRAAPADDPRFVPVTSGKFRATISERGSLESAALKSVMNQVEGITTIIAIKPEGSAVKKGDLICELDSAKLKDNLVNQEIVTRQLKSTYDNAASVRELAEMAVKEYAESSSKEEQNNLAGAITTARSAIERAESRLERTRLAVDRMRLLLQKKPIDHVTSSDLVADLDLKDRLDEAEQVLLREKLALASATAKKETYEKFTLARTTLGLEAAVKQAKSDEFAKKSAYTLEMTKENKLRKQIENCVLYAPFDGMLAYANDTSGQPNRPMIEEGATVRERQLLFSVIPIGGPLRVNAKVHEAIVDRLMAGQTAKIIVDALPNQEFFGKVRYIQPLPDANSGLNGDRKLYTTFVEIEKGSPALRPGMTAQVEILLAEVDDAIIVPRHSLLHFDRKTHVAVKKPDGGFEWREVTLGAFEWRGMTPAGARDDTRIEVKQGLKAGEMVADDPASLMTDEEKRQKLRQPKSDPARRQPTGTGAGPPRNPG